MGLKNCAPCLVRQLFEAAVPGVAVEQEGALVGRVGIAVFKLRINVPGSDRNVWPPIVVKVFQACSPAYKAVVHREAALTSGVFENCIPKIAIKDGQIPGKVGLEDVHSTGPAAVSDSQSHAGLLLSIVAVGYEIGR